MLSRLISSGFVAFCAQLRLIISAYSAVPSDHGRDEAKGIFLATPYDEFALTEQERNRFLGALGDGFFEDARGAHFEGVDLPSKVEAGLSKHRVFYDQATLTGFPSADKTEAFWSQEVAELNLFRRCPINFDFNHVRLYFMEQRLAFLYYLSRQLKFDLSETLAEEIYEEVRAAAGCRGVFRDGGRGRRHRHGRLRSC